jgi:hypothetical protein
MDRPFGGALRRNLYVPLLAPGKSPLCDLSPGANMI